MHCIKEIRIDFENCEDVTIPINCFGTCYLSNFHSTIHRMACNCVARVNWGGSVVLEIFSEADQLGYSIEGSDDSVIQRLCKYNDITHIIIRYDDDTEEEYAVEYVESGDYLGADNINQKTYLSELGNVYIVIHPERDIADYFLKENINDAAYMKHIKRMIIDNDD